MEKIKIDISEIVNLHERMLEIDSYSLNDIEFLDDSKNRVDIDEETKKKFRLTGLSNVDFIVSETYKLKSQKDV